MLFHYIAHMLVMISVFAFFFLLCVFKISGDRSPRFNAACHVFEGFLFGLYISTGSLSYLVLILGVSAFEAFAFVTSEGPGKAN
jgi:hypothetical protein